jgi:glycosyltransferase involved in cell wall biosynthesis
MKKIKKVVVMIPCYNEEKTIEKVIKDFKESMPTSEIHVFDNNSSDKTSFLAKKAGAQIHYVGLQGKGNVVRRMFADIEADIYVMVDGDDTYHAPSCKKLVDTLIDKKLDMVVGCRKEISIENNNYRRGHRLGNKLLTGFVMKIFGGKFTDMLSGYRVFSHRFVKSFPAESKGFEIETELTVHTLEMRLPYDEVETTYSERPEGSESKLSTYKDGIKILKMIIRLYSNERPLQFWGIIGVVMLSISIVLIIPIILEYAQIHQVPRFPTLIVASMLTIVGFISLTIGLMLRTVTKGRNEVKHSNYLSTSYLMARPK